MCALNPTEWSAVHRSQSRTSGSCASASLRPCRRRSQHATLPAVVLATRLDQLEFVRQLHITKSVKPHEHGVSIGDVQTTHVQVPQKKEEETALAFSGASA